MTRRKAVRAFAPATVSNVACGFDVLGFALENLGDEVVAELGEEPGVVLTKISGDEGQLPHDATRNTATVAAQALLDSLGSDVGVRLELRKGMPLASGLGSSAASAVAAVWAVSHLLEAGLSPHELLPSALAGEFVASGGFHADNVAPSLFGGLVLVRSYDPPDIVPLPVPEGMTCALVRPHVEVETRSARALLGEWVRLQDAVTQWGNLGGFTAALFTQDWELMRRSLRDVIAEPVRAAGVPGFCEVQRAAVDAGALGCSLSGSGPAIFALCRDRPAAEAVASAMSQALRQSADLPADCYVSPIHPLGARLRFDGDEAAF